MSKQKQQTELQKMYSKHGIYFIMALSEVIRIGYENIQNTSQEDFEKVCTGIKADQKPREIMTADFKIYIMELEREIVAKSQIMDIVQFEM